MPEKGVKVLADTDARRVLQSLGVALLARHRVLKAREAGF
jgi:hypothetical protein